MHGKPNLFRLAWLCVLLLAGAAAHAQDPIHRRYSLRDGLSSNTVYWAMQDRDGYMWFGTDLGACRFDGRTFTRFTQKDGLADNEVLEIHQDSKGRIWFLSFNGRLSYYADSYIHNDGNTPWLNGCRVRMGRPSFVEDAHGDLWFGSMPGDLMVVRADGRVEHPVPDPTRQGHYPRSVCVQREGNTMVVAESRQVHRLRPDGYTWELVYTEGHDSPACCASDARPHAWVSTGEGLSLVGSSGPPVPVIVDTAVARNVTSVRVFSTMAGDAWVSELNEGVRFFPKRTGCFGPATLFFPKEHITCAVEDRTGDLWFTTIGNGVLFVPKEQLASACFAGRVDPEEDFRKLLLDRDGSVWAGSGQGVVYHINGNHVDTVDLRIGRSIVERVNGLAQDGSGSIWAVTDAVVARLNNEAGRWRPRLLYNPGHFGGAKCITAAPDGTVDIGFFGVKKGRGLPNGEWRCSEDNGAIPSLRIYNLLYDREGALWFESTDTLLRYDGTSLQRYAFWVGPRYGCIKMLALLGADTIVVATQAGGIGLLHDGRVVGRYDRSNGPTSDECRALCVRDGLIHVVTTAGLSIIDPRRGTVVNTDQLDGLAITRVSDLVIDDHFLYVAAAQGVLRLPRIRSVRDTAPSPIHFASITVNGDARRADTVLLLQHGRDRLVVEATLVSFVLSGEPEYQYRTSADGPWYTSPSGRLELAALEPGDYDLRIRGRMQGRAWSAPLALTVHVSPPYWRSWWFRALVALLLTTCLLLGLRAWNQRRWRKRTELLRHRELLTTERQRIAMDMHDDLGADLSNLLLLTRVAVQEHGAPSHTMTRMESLAAGMMHRVDEIIWSLDPRQDTLGATVAFLDRYASDFARSHGLLFRSHVLDTEDRTPLPAPFRRDLYLLMKEALNNVAKHARAKHLRFQAASGNGRLHLLVEDDGVGRAGSPGATGRSGKGTGNMQRRAALMAGVVRHTDLEAGGTRVAIDVALPDHHPKG